MSDRQKGRFLLIGSLLTVALASVLLIISLTLLPEGKSSKLTSGMASASDITPAPLTGFSASTGQAAQDVSPDSQVAEVAETLFTPVWASPNTDNADNLSPPASPDQSSPDAGPDTPLVWIDRPDGEFNPGQGSGPISGRVTDPWGNGVPGVSVYIDSSLSACSKYYCSDRAPDGVTDPQGYYSISSYCDIKCLESGGEIDKRELQDSHRVYFVGAVGGFAAREWYDDGTGEQDGILVPAGSSGIDAVLVPLGTLVGRVHGVTGENTIVTVYRADQPEPIDHTTTAGMFGTLGQTFSFNLPPGDYKLIAYPEYRDAASRLLPTWYDRISDWQRATTISIHPGEKVSVNVNLRQAAAAPSGNIYGELLLFDMPPEPGTVISLTDSSDPNRIIAQKTLSPDDFQFDFRDLPAGSYKLGYILPRSGLGKWYGGAPEYSFGSDQDFDAATVITVGPAANSTHIIFNGSPDGADVSGHVVRPDGTGAPGISIYVRRFYQSANDYPVFFSMTQRDGEFQFSGNGGYGKSGYINGQSLPAGTFQVCAEEYDLQTGNWLAEYCRPRTITLDWFEVVSGFIINIPQDYGWPIEISGRIHTPDGSPANVLSVELDPDEAGAASLTTTSADGSGSYRFDGPSGLVPGDYHVCANVEDTNGGQARFCYQSEYVDYVWVAWHFGHKRRRHHGPAGICGRVCADHRPPARTAAREPAAGAG